MELPRQPDARVTAHRSSSLAAFKEFAPLPETHDHPFLGIPREQYLQIVQLTAERLGSQRSEPAPAELERLLRRWGVEPSRWLGVIEHFGSWFHRAVGRPQNLMRVIAPQGRKWIQGLRTCRDVFT